MDKWRYHPGIEALRDIARSGDLGPVHGLRTTRVGWGHPHPEDAVWVLVPHELSIALEILGSVPKPQSAVVDQVGGQAMGMVGWLGKTPWLVSEVSVRHPDRRREIRLYCRDGVAVLNDPYCEHVLISRSGGFASGVPPDTEKRSISTEFPLLRELRAFVEHLHGGPPPRSSAAEGAAIVEAIADLRVLAGLDPLPAPPSC
jgi:predicted dehydrogenase